MNFIKNTVIFLLIALIFIMPAYSEEKTIPRGAPITVDGRTDNQEWDDAASEDVHYQDWGILEISIKHDYKNLNFRYRFLMNNKRTVCIPELYIDTLADGGQDWHGDDWWFHVSARDAVSRGKPNDFSKIQLEFPDWKAVPNDQPGSNPSPIFEFEISIPFSMIGLVPGKTIGLACSGLAVLKDQGTIHKMVKLFPAGATVEHPGTWSRWIIR